MNIIIRGYRYSTTGRYWRASASTMSATKMASGNGNGSQTVSCIPGSPSFAPQKAQKQSLAGPDLLPKTNFALNTPGSMGEAPSIGRYRVDYRLMHVVVYRRWKARKLEAVTASGSALLPGRIMHALRLQPPKRRSARVPGYVLTYIQLVAHQ